MIIYKFLSLPSYEKTFLLNAYFYLLLWRIRLSFLPFSSLLDKCRNSPLTEISSAKLRPITSFVRLLNSASAFVPCTTCLSKACASHILLKKNGYLTDLHIGVLRNSDSNFLAHAWLSYKGQVVIGIRPDLNEYRDILPKNITHQPFA